MMIILIGQYQMKPYQQFNQRMNEMYRLSVSRRPKMEEKRAVFNRKGRMPVMVREHNGLACVTEPMEVYYRYCNDPHRIELKKSQINREKTILQRQKNEERFYRKVDSRNTPSATKNHKVLPPLQSPKTKVRTLSSDCDNLPQIYSKHSSYLNKKKIGIESSAMSELALIEAKSKVEESYRINRHKQLMNGLKGAKYFYSMNRSFSIPTEFSQH